MVASKETLELLSQDEFEVKLKAGKQYTPVRVEVENGRMFFWFNYYPPLVTEIKESFEGRRYHGFDEENPRKVWSAPLTQRNLFQFEALLGKYGPDPYNQWERSLITEQDVIDYGLNRKWKTIYPPESEETPSFYHHQIDLVIHGYSVRHFIWAAEMGTGKTLAAIILMEMLREEFDLDFHNVYWAAPGSALDAARVDFKFWNTPIAPRFMTPQGLKKAVDEWNVDAPPPRILILDESSRYKTPTSQRSVAAQMMADAMRDYWGDDCIIGELSGSPAPKAPTDWWKQCEIAAPGFVREQNIHVFRRRLGIMKKYESEVPGVGSFSKLVTWKDSENKCNLCGKPEEHEIHQSDLVFMNLQDDEQPHRYKKGVNEVERLSNRLEGLVNVKFKKNCLDLPDKRYKMFEVEPSEEILRAAQLVVKTAPRTVDALIRLRTLSDGFLYKEVPTGEKGTCPGCGGKGHQIEYRDKNDPDHFLLPEEIQEGVRFIYDECPEDDDPIEFVPKVINKVPVELIEHYVDCYLCNGECEVDIMERTTAKVACPKDDVLISLLEQHLEAGRFNVYAGFQGSVDRVLEICHRQGWHTVRADGRGWEFRTHQDEILPMTNPEMLNLFQHQKEEYQNVAFVGQPGAAGLGLTLTASPSTFFFSNDYNPESRIQAEDRGHRIGMDVIRGGWIFDVLHLPSDRKVLDSLRASRRLELMSLKALQRIYAHAA